MCERRAIAAWLARLGMAKERFWILGTWQASQAVAGRCFKVRRSVVVGGRDAVAAAARFRRGVCAAGQLGRVVLTADRCLRGSSGALSWGSAGPYRYAYCRSMAAGPRSMASQRRNAVRAAISHAKSAPHLLVPTFQRGASDALTDAPRTPSDAWGSH